MISKLRFFIVITILTCTVITILGISTLIFRLTVSTLTTMLTPGEVSSPGPRDTTVV